jgi:hypothetical protein
MSYVRVGILGSTTGGEVWSINPVFDPTGEFPGGVDQTALDQAAGQIAAITPGAILLGYLSTALAVTGARVEVRDDATDALIAISVATRATPLAGTGTARMPPQAAMVFSLRTNTPGASGRGRLYWPVLGASLGSNARFGPTDMSGAPGAMKSYLNSMRSILATNFPLITFDTAVRSKVTHTTPHVVRLQVGDVVDTQRRRRDNLPEAYTTTTLP